jgi:hypothetical protein
MKNIIIVSMISLASLIGCSNPEDTPTQSSPDPQPATPGNSIALKTDFAPPALEGTPPPAFKISRLEPAAKSAPSLMVPEGTVLLSKGKPVTASDDLPVSGELSYITDGDKEGGQGYFVALYEGLQWVQIDLEAEASLAAIWIWHTNGWPRAFHDVVVQASNDKTFQSGVTTLFNNDYDNTAKFGKGRDRPYIETQYGKLIDAKNTKARYVRLYSNGSTRNGQNVYIEVEVHGTPAS